LRYNGIVVFWPPIKAVVGLKQMKGKATISKNKVIMNDIALLQMQA
jgi:hypothetical protein